MKLYIRKMLFLLAALAALPLALAVGCAEVKGKDVKGKVTAKTTTKSGKTTTTTGKPGAVPFGLDGKKSGCGKCSHGKADSDCSKCPKYKAAATCTGPKCPNAKAGKPCDKCPHAKAGKSCDKCAKGTCDGRAGGKTCAGAKAPCAGALAKPDTVKGCDRVKMAAAVLKSGKKVLDGVTLKKSTAQSDLLSSADLYSGKTVRIEGPIVGICPGAGCWVALLGPKGKRINLKVTDGVVDFRTLAKVGVYAVGEGIFTKAGHHGAQIKITGARIGTTVCTQ